jgi:hypothetical protein
VGSETPKKNQPEMTVVLVVLSPPAELPFGRLPPPCKTLVIPCISAASGGHVEARLGGSLGWPIGGEPMADL